VRHARYAPGVPAAPPLTPDEREVLEVLMQPDRRVADCTVEAIAESLGTTFDSVHRTLRSLETRQPQLARPEVDRGLDIRFWHTTYEAAEAIEDRG
jgi:hypothetical protein